MQPIRMSEEQLQDLPNTYTNRRICLMSIKTHRTILWLTLVFGFGVLLQMLLQ